MTAPLTIANVGAPFMVLEELAEDLEVIAAAIYLENTDSLLGRAVERVARRMSDSLTAIDRAITSATDDMEWRTRETVPYDPAARRAKAEEAWAKSPASKPKASAKRRKAA